MKLLQLNIHNIASIEDATIDFSQGPLADTEVFLITGKTGSGKSTILDAICLALYAKTPRMSDQKDKEQSIDSDKLKLTSPLQLLRKNTGEGYVSLLFIGNNGVQYKATWAVHRAWNKADGTIRDKEWKLENLSSNTILNKVGDIESEIQIAVGLDFSQFCRTTLLAQGKFTEFLNSKDDEKAAILEKITGVDIYTKIGKKIYSKWSDIDKEYEKLKDKVGDIQLLKTLNDEQQQLTIQQQQLDRESRQQKELENSANKAKGHYENMAKNTEEIGKQQTKISQLQKEYSHILSGVGYIQQQVSETSKQISALENLIQAEASKAPVYQEQPAIAAHVTTILNNTSKRTQYLSNQNKKAQELTPKNNELTNAKKEADAAEDALKNHLEDQKKLDEQLEKADLPTKRRQKDEKIREKNAVEILSNDVQALENTDNQITEKRKRLQKIEQELAQLDEDKEQKTKHQEQANSTLLEAERKKQVWADTINDWAKAMRQKLQVGDICPVCRQQVTHIEVESLLDQKYQKAVEEYNKAKKDADDITSKIAEIDANIKAKTQEQKDKQSEIQKQEKDIANLQDYCKSQCEKYQIAYSDDIATTKTHIQEYITQADAEIKALEETIEKGEQIEKQLRESNNKLNKLQEDKDKKEKRFNEIKEQINTINTEITILKNNVQSCEENIKTASTKIHQFLQDTTWQHDWKIELEDFAQELKTASEKYQQNNIELTQAQQRKQTDETSLSSIQDQIDKLLEIMPEWRSIVATDKTDISDIQNQVNQLVADVQTAISRHADATRKKEDDEREYNTYIAQYPIEESTPVILQLEERIRQSRDKGEKLQQQIGEIKATLKQNADNCDKIADLHKKMQQLEGPKAMWNKLCNTLGLGTSDGKYFRIIAQSYVLSSLVNAANRYLAMLTNSRYRLTITLGSFLILIEDAENAYTKRSTGTISGGESFLVSLSLALALSDIGTLSVDTLFIDEGFGSLSGEALDNAINTLYSLHRTCGRKVGIISHIEDLRERIPVKIQVEQEANLSSSKITIVS